MHDREPRRADALLQGVRILTTRPASQCEGICARLRTHGAVVHNFPTIEIIGCTSADTTLAHIAEYDLAIFISGNAVEYGLAALSRAGTPLANLPTVIAVGQNTARLLESRGVAGVGCPAKPSSESLLQMPAVKELSSSARVILFRGTGGRELIAGGLRARGVKVDYAEVYQRRRPEKSRLSFAVFRPDLIMVTSREGLQNLYAMAAGKAHGELLRIPVLLGSRSMLALHEELGFRRQAIVAASPLDEDMVDAVLGDYVLNLTE